MTKTQENGRLKKMVADRDLEIDVLKEITQDNGRRRRFRSRIDAKVGIEQWRRHYNEVRPHSSLGYLTAAEFKASGLAGQVEGALASAAGSR